MSVTTTPTRIVETIRLRDHEVHDPYIIAGRHSSSSDWRRLGWRRWFPN